MGLGVVMIGQSLEEIEDDVRALAPQAVDQYAGIALEAELADAESGGSQVPSHVVDGFEDFVFGVRIGMGGTKDGSVVNDQHLHSSHPFSVDQGGKRVIEGEDTPSASENYHEASVGAGMNRGNCFWRSTAAPTIASISRACVQPHPCARITRSLDSGLRPGSGLTSRK